MPPRYFEQYNRMKRWQRRAFHLYEGGMPLLKEPTKTSDIPQDCQDRHKDELFAFFTTCYHLKDWLKNDKKLLISNDVIEDYINNTMCLSICADICNGSKHLTISKSRSGLKPEADKYTIVTRNDVTKIFFTIGTTTGSIDAFDLATACVYKWRHFIDMYIKKKEITPVV